MLARPMDNWKAKMIESDCMIVWVPEMIASHCMSLSTDILYNIRGKRTLAYFNNRTLAYFILVQFSGRHEDEILWSSVELVFWSLVATSGGAINLFFFSLKFSFWSLEILYYFILASFIAIALGEDGQLYCTRRDVVSTFFCTRRDRRRIKGFGSKERFRTQLTKT